MSNPRVLIIVLLYNSAEYIGDCFSSLQKIIYPTDKFKVLAIDNASTDASAATIKNNYPEVELIRSLKNVGFAGGNNLGFEYAAKHGFDYVYLLNVDTVVEPDFLDQALAVAQSDSRIAAVQSKLLLFSDQSKLNSIGNEIHYLGFGFAGGHATSDFEMNVKAVAYPSGAACLLDMAKLKSVGYFAPEFFMYHEDTDLGWRLWLNGYKCMLAPKSVVYHKYDFSRSITKYYFMERNRLMMILQNYKLGTLALIFPAWLGMELGLLPFAFVSGFWREKLKAYGYFFSVANIKKMSSRRQWVQTHRQMSDRDMLKHFVGEILFQDIKNPVLKYVANPIFNLYLKIIKRLIWW